MSAEEQNDDFDEWFRNAGNIYGTADSFTDPSQPSTSMDPGTSLGTNRPASRRRTNSGPIGDQGVSPTKSARSGEEESTSGNSTKFPTGDQFIQHVRSLTQQDEGSNPSTASVNREFRDGQSGVPAITVTTDHFLTGLPVRQSVQAHARQSVEPYFLSASQQNQPSTSAAGPFVPAPTGNIGHGNVFDPYHMNANFPGTLPNTVNPYFSQNQFSTSAAPFWGYQVTPGTVYPGVAHDQPGAPFAHEGFPNQEIGHPGIPHNQYSGFPNQEIGHPGIAHNQYRGFPNQGMYYPVAHNQPSAGFTVDGYPNQGRPNITNLPVYSTTNPSVYSTRPTGSTLEPVNVQSIGKFASSVAKDVDFRDYLMFNYTFSQKNPSDMPKSWISGILAVLSCLFTGEVPSVKPSSRQEQMSIVTHPITEQQQLAVSILRRLNTLVETTNNKKPNVFPCELYPFFHTLVLIVGSWRDNARKLFFPDVRERDNLSELLKQLVHEIVIYLEEEYTKEVVQQKTVGTSEQQKAFVSYLFENRHFLNGDHLKILKTFNDTVREGFFFINNRHDFLNPDVFKSLMSAINARKGVREEGVDDQRATAPPQGETSNAQLLSSSTTTTKPTAKIPEFSTISDWILGIRSFVYKQLTESASDESKFALVTDGQGQYALSRLLEPSRTLLKVFENLKGIFANGNNLIEATRNELRTFGHNVERICELLIIARKYEKQQFSKWKENSEYFIEDLLTSPKRQLDDTCFPSLRSVFNHPRERHSADSNALLEAGNTFSSFNDDRLNYTYLHVLDDVIKLLESTRTNAESVTSLPNVMRTHFYLTEIDGRDAKISYTEVANGKPLMRVELLKGIYSFEFDLRDQLCKSQEMEWDKVRSTAQYKYVAKHRNAFLKMLNDLTMEDGDLALKQWSATLPRQANTR